MKIMNLDHIGIRVMNVSVAVAFYEKLGFTVIRNDSDERVVVLQHESGVEINLLDTGNDDNNKQNILMDDKKKYPGYTHYAIAVSSIDDAERFLLSVGLQITEGPVTFGDGKSSIFVRDPDKNVIEFTQLP